MAALPFVFLTNELHVIPLATLQSGQHPQSIQITKNFFQPQIDDIKREFLEVKSMGSATAEEWLKGLDDRGKERRNDSTRWEKWETSGGVARMNAIEVKGPSKPITQPLSTTTPTPVLGPGLNGHAPSLPEHKPPLPQLSHLLPPIHTSLRKSTLHTYYFLQ